MPLALESIESFGNIINRGGFGLALPHLELTSLLTVKPIQNSKTWFLFTCSLLSDSFLSLRVTRRAADGNPCLSRASGLSR